MHNAYKGSFTVFNLHERALLDNLIQLVASEWASVARKLQHWIIGNEERCYCQILTSLNLHNCLFTVTSNWVVLYM